MSNLSSIVLSHYSYKTGFINESGISETLELVPTEYIPLFSHTLHHLRAPRQSLSKTNNKLIDILHGQTLAHRPRYISAQERFRYPVISAMRPTQHRKQWSLKCHVNATQRNQTKVNPFFHRLTLVIRRVFKSTNTSLYIHNLSPYPHTLRLRVF